MRDINKELEKFYALLDALESENSQQETANGAPEINSQPRQDRDPLPNNAARVQSPATDATSTRLTSQPPSGSPGSGVYPGKSFRTPSRTIEATQYDASAQSPVGPRVTEEPEFQSTPFRPELANQRDNVSQTTQQRGPDAFQSDPRHPATPDHSLPSAKESIQSIQSKTTPPASTSYLPADLIPASRKAQVPAEPTSPPTAVPNGKIIRERRANARTVADNRPGAPARPTQNEGRLAPPRPVVARPATQRPRTLPAEADPHFVSKLEKPSAADIKPVNPATFDRQLTPTANYAPPPKPPVTETPAAPAQSSPSGEESWQRKVKLPQVKGADVGYQQHKNLDSLVNDVKEGLSKRTSQPSAPLEAPALPTYVPDTKFSSTSSSRPVHGNTERIIAPELLQLPIEETSPRSRFTLIAAAVALVVPTVLAGVLVLNMSGNPDSVEMVASSTLENGKAVLTMTTNPDGARVYLNNQLIGVTPFSGVKIEPGDYVVTTEKEGFIQADTVLRISGTERIAFNLSRVDGDITTLPAGGHILSGLVSGDDSADDLEDDEGAALSESNDSSREEKATEERPAKTRPQTGGLVLTSEPTGATVWLNQEVLGETPLTLRNLTTGSYDVQLTKTGFDTYTTELKVSPSMTTPLHGKLNAVFGTIAVTVNVPADIFVDGQKLANAVSGLGRFEVAPGKHTVRAVSEQLGEKELAIEVEAGRTFEFDLSFETGGAPSKQLEEASRLFREGEYEAARKLYVNVQALQPDNALAGAKVKEIDRLLSAMQDQELTDAIIENGVYIVVDTPPQLVGGLEALHKNVVYPDAAFRAGIKGRVYIQFVVDEKGNPSDFSVTKGLPLGCNDAAIDAISKSKFKAGQFRGRDVKTRHTLFVNFGS